MEVGFLTVSLKKSETTSQDTILKVAGTEQGRK